MAVDIVDLTRFYDGPLGAHVASRLTQHIMRIWPEAAAANESVLAYGYGLPLRHGLWPDAAWHFLMPAQQGALAPQAGDPPLVLGDEGQWPLRAESVNRLIMLHGLEAANHLDGLMQETWRVLMPNGRALFIVANRRGLWARRDATPFGTGRPFSSGQMLRLMRRTGFVPGRSRPALLLPPFVPQRLLTSLAWLDHAGAFVLPQLGGVWLMEAIKKVPAPTGSKMALRYRQAAVVRPALSATRFPLTGSGEKA